MILPTKHIRPDRALLAVGADVLGCLREPMTVSRLWDEIRAARADRTVSAPISYDWFVRSEEHTSELQSLMRISYAVFCLKNKTMTHSTINNATYRTHTTTTTKL